MPKKKLVGGWTTHLKNMLVKLDHLPRDRSENSKNLWVATTGVAIFWGGTFLFLRGEQVHLAFHIHLGLNNFTGFAIITWNNPKK